MNNFLKSEHWSWKTIYFLGLICFLIHLNYFFKGEDNSYMKILAYGIISTFGFRAYLHTKRIDSKKE